MIRVFTGGSVSFSERFQFSRKCRMILLEERKIDIPDLVGFSKTFGTINHRLLLSNIEFYGVKSIALQLFADCFKDCSQIVKINTVWSVDIDTFCGVPQESNLSPVVYSVYVADFYYYHHILSGKL